ncbi:MAG TPA: transglycosylase SLT domain-containing protein [Candidatus Paceibacterota bacterium]|nr:transglycosylase SLT domain-containing protein [Candidatus Paceibacterota bacterium]
MRKAFALSAVLVLAFMPAVVLAAPDWLPLVQCGRAVTAGQQPVPCTPCDFFALGERLINMVLYGITGPIAAFMIVVAGGMMLLGGASPNQFAQGKKLLRNTLIGVAIILLAWLFTDFLIKSLGNGNPTDAWNQFTCPAELQAISAIDTQFVASGTLPAVPSPSPYQAKNIGAPSTASQQNLCAQGVNGKAFQCSSCRNLKPDGQQTLGTYMDNYAGGDANIVNAIMFAESSCTSNATGPTGDFGLMQLQPATARKYQDACDVYYKDSKGNYTTADGKPGGAKVPIPITAGFLEADANAKYVVCLGSKFISDLKSTCGSDIRNIAAGYNAGPGYCGASKDCTNMQSCAGGSMRAWECPWDDPAHTKPNKGLQVTRGYAPKVAYCAAHTGQ